LKVVIILFASFLVEIPQPNEFQFYTHNALLLLAMLAAAGYASS